MSAYAKGWNAFLDGKGQDDNPWTECSDSGQAWMDGHIEAEIVYDIEGSETPRMIEDSEDCR